MGRSNFSTNQLLSALTKRAYSRYQAQTVDYQHLEAATTTTGFRSNRREYSSAALLAEEYSLNIQNLVESNYDPFLKSVIQTDWVDLLIDLIGENAGDDLGRQFSLSSDGTKVAVASTSDVRVYEFDFTTFDLTTPETADTYNFGSIAEVITGIDVGLGDTVAMLTRTAGGAVFATLQKFDSTLTPGVSHPDIWSGTQTPTVFCSSDVKRVALFFPGQGFRVYDYLSNGQLSTGYYEMSDTSTSGAMSKNGLRAVTATGTYDIPATTPTQPVAIERLTSVPVSFDKVLSLSLGGNVVLAKVAAGIKVYVWTGASWKEQASLPNTASYDLGDMTVDTAYIAIAGSSDVRVFRYANDAYEDYGTITQQADSLSINQNGDRLVIGQQVNGSSLTFVLSGAGRWLRRTTTQAPGEGKPECAKVSNDGKTFVSASDLVINTLGTSRVTQFPVGWKQKGSSISVSATSTSLSDDGKFLVVGLPDEMNFEGTQSGRLRVYRDGVQYGLDLTYDKSVNSNTEVTITPDGTKIAAGENGTVRVYTPSHVTVKNATTVNTISVTPQSSVFEMSGDGTRLLVHHQIFDDGVSVGSVSAGDAFHLSNDGNYLAVETNNVASLYGIDSQGVVSLVGTNILPTDSADLAGDYRTNTANAGTKINVNAANSELLTLASSYGTTTEIASLTYDTSTFTTQTTAPRATITHNTSIAEAFSTSAYGIVLSRDGGTLAVYDNTKFSIYSYTNSTWTFVRTKTVTSGPYLVVLSYDGSRVAYRDGDLRIENTATGVSLGSISVTSLYTYAFRSNTALALLQGTNYYSIPGTSNNIELYNYDGTNWTLGETLTISMTIASSRLLFSGDGDRLAVGDTYNRVVTFFDYDRTLTPPVTTFVQDGSAHSASVLALSGNGDVKVIGTSTDVEIIEASGTTTFTGAATSVDVSSDGTRVLVGTSSKMYVVEKSGGVWTQLGSDIAGNAPEVAISPDGSKIFSNDGALLKSYELVSGSWTTYLPDVTTSYVSKISTSTNGNIVAVRPNVYSRQTITTTAGYSFTLSTAYNSNYVTNQAVSGNGNVRVITNKNANSSTGEAVIYEKVNGAWSTTASATFTGASATEEFGRDVDVSKDGTRVVIGSATKMVVVEKSGGTWSQLGSDISGSTTYVGISRDGSKVFNYDGSSLKSYELVSGSWTQYLPDLAGLSSISEVQASNDGDIVALSKGNSNQVYSKQNVTTSGGYSISEAASLSEPNGSRISDNGSVLVTLSNKIFEKDSSGNWPSTPSFTFTGSSSSLVVGVSDDGTRVAMQSASAITVVEKPSSATTTYTVTVASVGGGNRYHIDGVDRPQLTFYRGNTYVFDLSDSSNSNHPLGFVTASPYTDGVVNNYSTNPPGSAGSQVTWTVPATAPSTISYYCEVHGTGMGTTNTVADRVWAQIGSDITGSFIAVTGSCMTGDGTKVFGSSAAQSAGTNFTQVGSDIDGEAASDYSGSSVSMNADGTRVVIGAYGNDGNGNDSGHVRVYEESGGTWTQVGSDIDGETSGDKSGTSVSMNADGTRVVIGAPSNNSWTGHARVYAESGGVWTQVGSDIDGEAQWDESGRSVSMSADGTRVAIGAASNNSLTGHVRVYDESGGVWTQVGSDIDGEAVQDLSGRSVSLSGDGTRVAIGAIWNDGTANAAGHVRVYAESGGVWTQVGGDIDGEAAQDQYGNSVSMNEDGTRVAIGAPNNDGTGSQAGHVRVYAESGGTWTQVGSDIDGEAAGDFFSTVSLSSNGTKLAVGGWGNDGTSGTDRGHVRVYEESGGTWTQVGVDIDGEAAGDQSGRSISMSPDGTRIAIGASYNDGGTGTDSGHVRVYSIYQPGAPAATSSWEYSGGSWSQYRPDITSSLNVTRISHSTNGEILGLEDANKVIIYATTSSGSSYSKRHADASYSTSYHSLSDDGSQLISRGYDGSSSWNGTNYVYDGAGATQTIWGPSTNHFIEVSGNGNLVFHVDLSSNTLKLYSKSISNGDVSWTQETDLAFTYYPVLASGLASDAIVVTGSGSAGAKIYDVTYTPGTTTAQYATRGSTFSGYQISMSDDGSKIVSTVNPKSSTTWNGTDYVYDGSNAATQGAPWLYWSGGEMPMWMVTQRRVFMSGDGNRVLLVANDGFYMFVEVYVMLFYRVGNEWSSTDVNYLEYTGTWSPASINTTGDFFGMNYGRFYDILYDPGTTSDQYAIRGTGLGFASNHALSEDGNYVVYTHVSPGAKAWNGTSWAYNGPTSTSAGWSSNHTLLALSGDATKAVAFKSTTNEVILYTKDAQQQWSQSVTLAQSGVTALSIDTDGSIIGVAANGQTKFYTFGSTQSVIGWGSHSSISGSSAPGFAQALDISNDGDTVVIGVAGDGTGTYRGEVRVYDYASSWIARATITPPSETGAAVGDAGYRNLGKSVSISDDGVRIAYLVDQGDYVDDGQTTHSIVLTNPHNEIYSTNQYNAGYWGWDLYAWASMIRLATGNDNNGIYFPVTFGAQWSVTFEWDPSGAANEDMRFIFYAPNQPSSYAGSQHGGYYIEYEFAGMDSLHIRTPTGSGLSARTVYTPYNTSGTFTTVTITYDNGYITTSVAGSISHSYTFTGSHLSAHQALWGTNTYIAISSRLSSVNAHQYIKDINASWTVPNPPVFNSTNRSEASTRDWDGSAWVNPAYANDETTQIEIVPASDNNELDAISMSYDGSRFGVGPTAMVKHLEKVVTTNGPFTRGWTARGSIVSFDTTDSIAATTSRTMRTSTDGNTVAFGYLNSGGVKIRVYGFASGSWSQLGSEISTTGTTISMDMSNDGTRVAVLSDATARVFVYYYGAWSQLGSSIATRPGIVKISGNGNYLAIGTNSPSDAYQFNTLRVYEKLADWELVSPTMTLAKTPSNFFGVGFGLRDDGSQLVHYTDSGVNFSTFNTATVQTFSKHGTDITGNGVGSKLAFDNNGNTLVTSSFTDDIVRVYDSNHNSVANFTALSSYVKTPSGDQLIASKPFSITKDGNKIVTVAATGQVVVYKKQGGTWSQDGNAVTVTGDRVSSVDITNDGQRIIAGTVTETSFSNTTGKAQVFDLANGVWSQVGTDILPLTGTEHRFANVVAISDTGYATVSGQSAYNGGQPLGIFQTFNLVTELQDLTFKAPTISLVGNSYIKLAAGSDYTELGAVVDTEASVVPEIKISGSVQSRTPGTYTLRYECEDLLRKKATPIFREVEVVQELPSFRLKGESLIYHAKDAAYTDAGVEFTGYASGSDFVGYYSAPNSLDASPLVSGGFTPNAEGDWSVYWTDQIVDRHFRTAPKQVRTIRVRERPAVSLVGDSVIYHPSSDVFTDPGSTVTQSGGFQGSIAVTGLSNLSRVGVFTGTYIAVDKFGIESVPVTRNVDVRQKPSITSAQTSFYNILDDPISVPTPTVSPSNLASLLQSSNNININAKGRYAITHTLTDSVGISAKPFTQQFFVDSHGSLLHTASGTVSALSRNGDDLAVFDTTLKTFRVSDFEQYGDVAVPAPVTSIKFTPDAQYMVVGMSSHLTIGLVRVYKKNIVFAGGWEQVGFDLFGVDYLGKFGESVDINSGATRIVVGAPEAGTAISKSGSVKIYDWTGFFWQQSSFVIEGTIPSQFLGFSVSLDNEGVTLAVGSPGHSRTTVSGSTVTTTNVGKASVYKLVGSDWQLSGSEIEDGTEEKRNGTSVSLSRDGKTLAVGSVLGGGVRVYTLGVDWTGTHVPGNFGESVSLSSDGRTFVAGSKDEHKGRVYKYALGVGGWSRSTDTFDTIVAGEGSTTMLGKSVSLDGSGEVLCVSSNADVRIYGV